MTINEEIKTVYTNWIFIFIELKNREKKVNDINVARFNPFASILMRVDDVFRE